MSGLREVVVCSLEEWDEVWRRNQFFADRLLRRDPELRILFVEPPADPLYDLAMRRPPSGPRLRRPTSDRRLWVFRPLKPLPRRAGRVVDAALRRQVVLAARALRLSRPVLWLNDVTYAPLIDAAGWPTAYDVTDDWLSAPASSREHRRLKALDELALARADAVVVCSPDLARSRGAYRDVVLVPNGVDVPHFRRPQARPADLPAGPSAVYVGSLHDSRLDTELVASLARSLEGVSVVLVGPDSLSPSARALLRAQPSVRLLGPRPHAVVPAYLQHADVIVVPHLVNAFTESLDPIKAYECLAVSTPTVATPVAGFRDLSDVLTIAPRESFVAAVRELLAHPPVERPVRDVPDWDDRAASFAGVLDRLAERA